MEKLNRYEDRKVYTVAADYFLLGGDSNMLFSRDAAIKLCQLCIDNELIVSRVEAGIWHQEQSKFEPRIDGVWDGVSPPVTKDIVYDNNIRALNNIKFEQINYDVFVLMILKNEEYIFKW